MECWGSQNGMEKAEQWEYGRRRCQKIFLQKKLSYQQQETAYVGRSSPCTGKNGTIFQGTSHAAHNLRMTKKAASDSERLLTFTNLYYYYFFNCECKFMG